MAPGICFRSSRSTKSNTTDETAAVRRFAQRTASVMYRRSWAITGSSAVTYVRYTGKHAMTSFSVEIRLYSVKSRKWRLRSEKRFS